MIKFIATDIDGTILKHDFIFNQSVKDCIKKLSKNDIKVVLVTGRMHSATDFVAQELELNTPIVSYQGGLIMHNENILYEKNLDTTYAREIISWAKDEDVHINLYMNDKLYVERDDEIIRRYTGERKAGFIVKSFDMLELERINKILIIDFNNEKRITEYQKQLSKKYPSLHIVKSMPYFCEVCNGQATKESAVNFLKTYWKLNDEEVLTIGDQNNDISLLKAGGIKVAMGNATEELKAVADYVTDTVENDGFVKAVERFIYNEAKI